MLSALLFSQPILQVVLVARVVSMSVGARTWASYECNGHIFRHMLLGDSGEAFLFIMTGGRISVSVVSPSLSHSFVRILFAGNGGEEEWLRRNSFRSHVPMF
eukprot:GHVU01040941.1.p1 GENE.GHVU01040941.1~~GHVU01040941.1.p1  ORF type:complete len:102 (+),score=1.88 GHVU01040941.1:929-1234(+)